MSHLSCAETSTYELTPTDEEKNSMKLAALLSAALKQFSSADFDS